MNGGGNDDLRGGNGRDSLFGKEGNDKLKGGNGDDRLNGGQGDDVMEAGAGADLFVFKLATGEIDEVTDFDPTVDRAVLAATGFDPAADVSFSRQDAQGEFGGALIVPASGARIALEAVDGATFASDVWIDAIFAT